MALLSVHATHRRLQWKACEGFYAGGRVMLGHPLRVLIFVSVLWATSIVAADPTSHALALFREYESRAARFDPSLADLYSDDALIWTKRIGAGGGARELSFKGDKWKTMIRLGMPLAKIRGDTNRFDDLMARKVGDDVVISAYRSPFTLVVRKSADAWRIVEERSETWP
jgi:hypothetical protein